MQPVARLTDLPDGTPVAQKSGDTDILLIRQGDRVHAIGAKCPHAQAPLIEGAVCGNRIICPWHKSVFHFDGTLIEPPALQDLPRYDVEIADGIVSVSAEPLQTRLPPAPTNTTTALVAGTGAGGIAAAVALRRGGFPGKILLIGDEADRPYDRTSLSKFVPSGEMPPDDVPPLLPDDYWRAHHIDKLTAHIVRLDARTRRVHLSSGALLTYDTAILAPGSQPTRLDLPGATLRGIHTLRATEDAAAIVAGARPDAHAVIIGSSFIGLEVASALRTRKLHVTVISPDAIPFVKQFGPLIGDALKRLHIQNGVAFHRPTKPVAFLGATDVTAVALEDGSTIPADLVIIGTGVHPAISFVEGVQKSADGGITTDAHLLAAPHLHVVGDAASFPFHGRSTRIEHWRLAQQQGFAAAAIVNGSPAPYASVPYFWTYHFGKNIEYIGHADKWDETAIIGNLDTQSFIAFLVNDGYVDAVVACGHERETCGLIERMRMPLSLDDANDLVGAVA